MLRARIVTALFLVAGFLCVLFLLPRAATVAVFALVAALAAWEWAGLLKLGGTGRVGYGALVAASCLAAYGYASLVFPVLWLLATAFWLLTVPPWLARGWPLASQPFLALIVGWIVIVPTWAALVDLHSRSPWLLLSIMALVWVADIAAYFAGRAFGRRKLAPAISPGKTWEGVAGGAVAVLAYGFAAVAATQRPVPGHWLGFAALLVLLTALSVVGDLFESLAKRQAQVKDSSGLLPGHGGILDRIDSLTSTLPLVAFLLLQIQP